MSEKALVVVLEHILEEIKKFNANQLVFMAFLESKVPSLEYKEEKGENTTVVEEMTQDLENVMIMAQSDKAMLVVKNGYMKWVAFSLIHAPKTFDLGGTYDIILRKKKDSENTDPENWFHTKLWEKYVPQKKGG